MDKSKRFFLKSMLAATAAGAIPLTLYAKLSSNDNDRFISTWKNGDKFESGIISIKNGEMDVIYSFNIPSRAHHILYEGEGSWLVVSRRPGLWLLRHYPDGKIEQVSINSNDLRFSGHVQKSHDAKLLYTTEFSQKSGETYIGVRDAITLKKLTQFKTGRTDPHSLILDEFGHIYVANGGIPKHIDASIVNPKDNPVQSFITKHNPNNGELLDEWTLEDENLSMRHLAWVKSNDEYILGASIKCAHPTLEERIRSPILAVLKDGKLKAANSTANFGGYAGDIHSANGLFYVSCAPANKVAVHNPFNSNTTYMAMHDVCALSSNYNGDVFYSGPLETGYTKAGSGTIIRSEIIKSIAVENHSDFVFDNYKA